MLSSLPTTGKFTQHCAPVTNVQRCVPSRLLRGKTKPCSTALVAKCAGATAAISNWPATESLLLGSVEELELQSALEAELIAKAPPKPVKPIQPPAVVPRTPVVMLETPEAFNELLAGAGEQLIVVDFYTDWCGPCQLMHKEVDKMTHVFPKNVVFAKFNVGPWGAFATSQRIRSLPTFKLFQRGRCLDQVSGAKPVQLRQLLTHYYRGR